MSFHSRQSLSVSFFHVCLGLPAPRLPSICLSHAVVIATLECSTCPNQRSLLSLKMRSRSSSSSFASKSLDLTVATSSGLILQICLIMALSLRCQLCRFVLVSDQVLLAWSMALRTQEPYTWPFVLKERWQYVRTGSSSLNFFQAVFHTSSNRYFTASTSRKHVTQVAEGSYHLQLIRSGLDFILWPAVNRVDISHAPCTPVIRIWCQSL